MFFLVSGCVPEICKFLINENEFSGIDHGPPVSNGHGWNDPPAAALAMAKSKAASKTSTVNAITSPITQPLAGMPAPDPQPPQMNYGYQQPQGYYGAPPQQPTFEAQPAPPPANLMTPFQPQQSQDQLQQQGYQGFQPQMPPANQPQVQAAPPPEPPKPVEKGPIPAEHQVLQDVFNGLKNKCLSASNHPVSIFLMVCL